MKNLKSLIKEKAIEIGFDKVGIAEAKETTKEKERLNIWIKNGSNASMKWIENRKNERGDINVYFPEAKTVVSVGLNYNVGNNQKDIKSDYKFSNYAWGEDYHRILKKKLYDLLSLIKKSEPNVKGLVCVDTAPVMEKVWAQRAGLGWIGKHTNLITPDYGSWLFLGELILDIKLKPDPLFDADLCGSCTSCIESCPTNALTEYQIESQKCISYKTIEYRGDFLDQNEDLHGWIYGCDICQDVCPWNNKFSKESSLKEFLPREEIVEWSNDDWNDLDEDSFRRIFKGSSVKRTKFIGLKRNLNHNKNRKV